MIEALYHRSLASPEAAFESLQDDLRRYERLGRYALCEALLNAASDFLVQHPTGQDAGGYAPWLDVWRARLAKAAGRHAEAERTLRELLHRIETPVPPASPGGPLRLRLQALDLLAGVLTDGHRYPEALRLYRQVLRLSGMLHEAGDAEQAWELALEATIRARTTDVLGASDVQREVAETILGLGCAGEPWLMDTVRAEFRGMLGALGSSLLLLGLESTYVEHLMCGGQLDRAAAALSDLLELAQIASTDRRGQIALQCGRLAQARGSLDAADEQYEEALRLGGDPAGSDLLEIRALLSRGRLAAIRGRWPIALAARLELAAMHQRRGDIGLAAEEADGVRRALEWTRSDLVARCHL